MNVPRLSPVLIPPEDVVVHAGIDFILVDWREPNATYDEVSISCVGDDGANNGSDVVQRNEDSEGICELLTPGASYTVIVSTVLNDGAVDPADTITHIITGRLLYIYIYMWRYRY